MNLYNAGRTRSQAAGQVPAPIALALPIALAVMMVGCVTTPADNREQSELIAERLDAYVLEEGTVRHDVTDENVARLWQEFNIMRRSGNFPEAKAKIEQAIAIAPRDPALWSSAAELELEESSHLRAENYAAKSNFLANVGNRPLRYRNWLIIQRAREGRGDLLGAREAEIESSKFTNN